MTTSAKAADQSSGASLAATPDRDLFTITAGGGSPSISGFAAGAGGDALVLTNFGFTSLASFRAACTQSGDDTLVALGQGESLTLRNVRLTDITTANLLFDRTLPLSAAATAWLTAQSGSATLYGTTGNDQLSSGQATGTLAGGKGDDLYCVSSDAVAVVEAAGQGIDTVMSWARSYTLSAAQAIENLFLQGSGDSAGTGNRLDNRIVGNGGANLLSGERGNDVLTGGGGRDTFVFKPYDGVDVITDFTAKGASADVIRIERYGYASLSELRPRMTQVGADVAIWLSNSDTLTLKNVALDDLTDANFGFLSIFKPMNLTGTDGADALVGGRSNDTLTGGRGNDTLTGSTGVDTFALFKGDGSDTITDFAAGRTGDRLHLTGYDFASFAEFRAALTQAGADTKVALGNGEVLTLKNVSAEAIASTQVTIDYTLPVSASPTNWMSCSTAGASVTGTAANDRISVGAAGVTIAGGRGDDTYSVVAGDTLVEKAGEGIDTVLAWTNEGFALPDNVENITLVQDGNAWVRGNDGANIVTGGTGDNTIVGGKGNDILTGGGGRDLFVVAKGDGSDFVTDFTAGPSGRDVVRLDGFGLTSFAAIAARLSQSGADAVLDLGDGAMLTLRNVSAASLTAANFALPVDTSGMTRTFSDDFSSFSRVSGGEGTWMTQFTYGGRSSYTLPANAEAQLYVDPDFKGLPGTVSADSLGLNPFAVDDGKLVVSAKPITDAARPYTADFGWTSGLITTQSSFAQTYGYFEITAELPQVKGAWPAFWLLPADNSGGSELDVFEYLGSRTDSLTSAVHSRSTDMQLNWQPVVGLTAGKHSFGALWTPYGIDIFIDGLKAAHYATPDEMSRPMYMLANLAMGGSWGGAPDEGASAQYKIDSITAYQLPEYTLAGYRLKESAAATKGIAGTLGADTLLGTNGADRLDGRGGTDRLAGGLGDDTYVVRTADTKVTEKLGEGIDTIQSVVSIVLPVNVENLTLLGAGAINATGHDGANILTGNAGANVLRGAVGNDVLTGGAGRDTFAFTKGDGSDIVTDFDAGPGLGDVVKLDGFWFTSFEDVASALSQHGSDVYLQLAESETLVFRDHRVADFAADDFLLPASPPDSAAPIRWVQGTAASETLYGTALNESLQGRGGVDTLVGGDGDDTYLGSPGVTIVEKAGGGVDAVETWMSSYTLPGHVENLKLMGSGQEGAGNGLANRITGSSGNDRIDGNGGNDWLAGGAGKDSFVFDTQPDALINRDTITDFSVADDTIVLARSAFAGIGAAGTLAAGAFEARGTARDAADRILYDKASGDLWFDADGSGASAAVKFAHVGPGLALTAADFLIV